MSAGQPNKNSLQLWNGSQYSETRVLTPLDLLPVPDMVFEGSTVRFLNCHGCTIIAEKYIKKKAGVHRIKRFVSGINFVSPTRLDAGHPTLIVPGGDELGAGGSRTVLVTSELNQVDNGIYQYYSAGEGEVWQESRWWDQPHPDPATNLFNLHIQISADNSEWMILGRPAAGVDPITVLPFDINAFPVVSPHRGKRWMQVKTSLNNTMTLDTIGRFRFRYAQENSVSDPSPVVRHYRDPDHNNVFKFKP